ncbi:MAG TPA: chemotaxis protein CheD [Novosphingobium sp.]|nr:chemotaxis protein CheD [Novosphingobium sp.]
MNPLSASACTGLNRVTVMQGQVKVSISRDDELTTILGSCVATCLFDATAGVGGMNHFLLAAPPSSHDPAKVDVHYGVYLMEILINEMLTRGASKARMRAHLYGGEFARAFLRGEGIPLMREDMGGASARRVDFRPACGQVRCRSVENRLASETLPRPRQPSSGGDLELF